MSAPCIACYADTETLIALQGEGEFLMAGLQKIDVTEVDSSRLVLDVAHEKYGCDPGYLPVEDMKMLIRVCTDCGAKAGFDPGPETAVPLYQQPEGWKLGMKIEENPPWQ